MNNSRTTNSIKNVSIGIVMQMISLVFTFISRKFFIDILGNDYLSINGLFSNILVLLSFAELGIGSAITFSLYKPLKDNDKQAISAVVNTLKKAQLIISVVVMVMGFAIIPFLRYIVKDVPDIAENITFIYILFVINTSISYLFAYPRVVLIADQKNYVVSISKEIISMVVLAINIAILVFTGNYILYLLIQIGSTFGNNLILYFYFKKWYPYIDHKATMKSEDKSLLIKNIRSIFIYKVSSNLLTGTDNIIISAMIATALIGKCSNHVLIISYANTFLQMIAENIMASIGNLNASSDLNRRKKVLYEAHFMSFWVYALACVLMAVFLNPVVTLFFEKQFELSEWIVISLVLNTYLIGLNSIPSVFRSTMGLFNEAKLIPLFAAVINIVLSVILANPLGLFGVFIATCVSRVLTFTLFDPYFVFKKGFKEKGAAKFQLINLLYFVLAVFMYFVIRFTVSLIDIPGFVGLAIKGIVAFVLCNLLIVVCFYRTQAFKDFTNRIKNVIINRRV